MSRIRITGGTLRSRLISVADAEGLRPTPDRVRETLFNWLGQDLSGLTCLDLFAGSGVLGFEAASRGAAKVTLVERDARVFARLQENAQTLGLDQSQTVKLFRCDALKFLALAEEQKTRFDVILLDPPYHQGWIERVAPLFSRVAAPDAWLYAEAEKGIEALESDSDGYRWRTVRHGRAGQVFYHLLEQEQT